MLVEFKVSNFRSFRDEQCLSLAASNVSELPENIFPVEALDEFALLRSAIIYGPNASGKSNLVGAISALRFLVLQSSELPPGHYPPEWSWIDRVVPFRLDQRSPSEPTNFEITFVLDRVRYQYGFSVVAKRVAREFLVAFPNKVPQRWFDRRPPSEGDEGWTWSEHLKGEKKRIAALTRPDSLFLSVAAKLNHQQLSPLYSWFRDSLQIIENSPDYFDSIETTVQLANEDEAYRNTITSALKAADLGIDSFEIAMPAEGASNIKLPDGRIVRRPGRVLPTIRTFHPVTGSSEKVTFDMRRDESLGTRRFFGLIGVWLKALKSAQVIITDELDASMHPMLTRFLVNLFNDPKSNPKNAQAIFTTHDTTLLDNTMFRRDQIWFTEKDKEGSSHLYSLLMYRPRKNESLQKGYLSGSYGAIPFIGEIFF